MSDTFKTRTDTSPSEAAGRLSRPPASTLDSGAARRDTARRASVFTTHVCVSRSDERTDGRNRGREARFRRVV